MIGFLYHLLYQENLNKHVKLQHAIFSDDMIMEEGTFDKRK